MVSKFSVLVSLQMRNFFVFFFPVSATITADTADGKRSVVVVYIVIGSSLPCPPCLAHFEREAFGYLSREARQLLYRPLFGS